LDSGSSIGSLVEIILVLAVVFFMAWYITRFIGMRSKGKAAGRFMRVVDRLAISNDKALLLVKIGSEYCVVGIAGHEMNLIAKLDEAQARAFEEENSAGAQPNADVWKGMQSFGARLASAMRGGPRQPAQSQPKPQVKPQAKQPDDQSVLDMMNERIKLRKETKRW
jgi:flagellar protein FliO/FliZ